MYYLAMRKISAAVLVMALLAGCSGTRKSDSDDLGLDNPLYGEELASPPDYALPGVPLRSEVMRDVPPTPASEKAPVPEVAPAGTKTAEAVPAEPKPAEAKQAEAVPAEAMAAETKPAAAASEPGKDLAFHMAAAAKYSARKKYRSAAAEYGAAVEFLPAGDDRAVRLLERQGAMLLKAGAVSKAQPYFESAIGKAKELGASGKPLADSYLGLGYCQEKTKKVQDAIDSYQKALELTGGKTAKARIAQTILDLKKTQ